MDGLAEKSVYRMANKTEITKYAFGGLGSNIQFMLVTTYAMFFFTDMAGVSPAVVGTLLFVSRIVDAVTDPLMGSIADRTRTKMGRYRPYVTYGAPLLGTSIVLMFWDPGLSGTAQVVYVYAVYIAYSLLVTVVDISYHALTPVLSEDPDQRTTIATAKQFMNVPANLIVQVLALPIVGFFMNIVGNESRAWTMTAIVCAIFMTVAFWVCQSGAKEHDQLKYVNGGKKVDIPFKKQFALIGKNPPLIMLMIAMSTNLLAQSTMQATVLYFWTYNVGRPDLFPTMNFVGLILSIPAFLLMPMVVKKIGKRNLLIWGSVAAIIPPAIIMFFPSDQLFIMFGASMLIQALAVFTGSLPWAMVPDCVDYGQWKTGIRGDGFVTSSFTFINKFGRAIGGAIGGFLLAAGGYVANQPQTTESLRMILANVALIPILGHIATIIAMKWYSINNKNHAEIIKEINESKVTETV